MKRLTIDEAREMKCGELLDTIANGEPVLLTENGEARYILGGVDDLEWEAFALSRNQEFMDFLDACRARGEREGRIPMDEMRRRLEAH